MQIGCLVYNIFVIGTFTVCVDWVAELVYVDWFWFQFVKEFNVIATGRSAW